MTDIDLDSMSVDETLALRDRLRKVVHGSYPYRADPVGWAAHTGVHLWSAQQRIAEAVRDNRRVAVVATHGIGKSFLAAQLVVWWIDQHPPGEAQVITTAPTGEQVKLILWREINKAHRRAGAIGEVSLTQWRIGNEIVAVGRKPSDYNEHAFQGLHARYLLVVLDECSGVTAQLWRDAGKLITNEDCRILAIGNPDREGSQFHKTTESPLWHVERIAFSQTPAATGETVQGDLLDRLVSQLWVDELIAEEGADSAVVQRQVEGRFVTDGDEDKVIRRSKVIASRAAAETTDAIVEGEKVVGIDVGGGVDRTVCRLIVGGSFISAELIITSGEPREMARRCATFCTTVGADLVHVDEIGVGRGLIGHLRDLLPDTIVRGINVATKASEPDRFSSRRDEVWWHMREAFADNELTWLEAYDDEIVQELCTPSWVEERGRIRVESKKEMRRRLGRSPDRADALILANASTTGYSAGLVWA